MNPIRILLVDDSPEFIRSATMFLATEPDIYVVACSRSGGEAVAKAAELVPDLILMDLAMPGMNGLAATGLIKAQKQPARVILLTLHDSPAYRSAGAQVYADGFVAKSDFATQLMPLIRTLFRDGASKTPTESK